MLQRLLSCTEIIRFPSGHILKVIILHYNVSGFGSQISNHTPRWSPQRLLQRFLVGTEIDWILSRHVCWRYRRTKVVTASVVLYRKYWFLSIHLIEAHSGCYSDCCRVQKSPDFRAHSSLNLPAVVSATVVLYRNQVFSEHTPCQSYRRLLRRLLLCTEISWYPSTLFAEPTSGGFTNCCFVQKSTTCNIQGDALLKQSFPFDVHPSPLASAQSAAWWLWSLPLL